MIKNSIWPMIKSNWPIKNLIMSLDLIFMQIRPIIISFDLVFAFCFSIFCHNEVQLGLEIPLKIAAWFPSLLSPRCQPLFYFLIFIFEKEIDFFLFLGITQNWVMTVNMVWPVLTQWTRFWSEITVLTRNSPKLIFYPGRHGLTRIDPVN